MNSDQPPTVMVYGASGHTGRFVVDELRRRGITTIAAGRDGARLGAAADVERRVFGLSDVGTVAAALADVDVVINAAGPFLDTALPLASGAVAAGTHYLDVTAEQPVVRALYADLDDPAREAGIAVVPAMAFYGGLADLMASALLGSDRRPAEVTVAIGLDHWWPTAGTRITGERNTASRQVIRDGALTALAAPAPTAAWSFTGLGEQEVVELPFSEVITMHRHLPLARLTSYLNTASLTELRDAATPAPEAADEHGRSRQRFAVEVVVRHGDDERRTTVSGRDIYAVTAPIVVEGALRLADGRRRGCGALAPGQAFDAADILAVLHESGALVGGPAAS